MVAVGLVAPLVVAAQPSRDRLPLEHPAIGYSTAGLDNPVTWLTTRLEEGRSSLPAPRDPLDHLASLLGELDIDPDTQTLVFSKTSFQKALISPRQPRAIYFNDDTVVAYVPGGDLELAVSDPAAGVAFYGVSSRGGDATGFMRTTHCLECHYTPRTLGVPGLLVASVGVSDDGVPVTDQTVTDHRTPFSRRWGGWFVDGVAPPSRAPAAPSSDIFDRNRYLRPWSDPVALMTLEHQSQMANLLTRLAWESRLHRHDGLIGYGLAERMTDRVDEVLAYMLFVDEAPLTAPIEGPSPFRQSFPRRGPHDRFGRSLRDFDLETRLFRYPLSYMIYSRAFDAIEPVVREFLLRRLYDVLTGDDPRPIYDRLSAADRQAVLSILRDTKPNLPTYWRTRREGR